MFLRIFLIVVVFACQSCMYASLSLEQAAVEGRLFSGHTSSMVTEKLGNQTCLEWKFQPGENDLKFLDGFWVSCAVKYVQNSPLAAHVKSRVDFPLGPKSNKHCFKINFDNTIYKQAMLNCSTCAYSKVSSGVMKQGDKKCAKFHTFIRNGCSNDRCTSET